MAGGKFAWLSGVKNYGRHVLWAIVVLYLVNLIALLTVALRSFADVLVLFGSWWLGALIGLLLGFHVQDSGRADPKAVGVSLLVFGGSIIFIILRYLGDLHEVWFYPMGMVGGFIISLLWKYADAE